MKNILMSLIILFVLVIGIYIVIGLINSNPPKATITAEGNELEVAQGSYCWKGLINEKCVDMILDLSQ